MSGGQSSKRRDEYQLPVTRSTWTSLQAEILHLKAKAYDERFVMTMYDLMQRKYVESKTLDDLTLDDRLEMPQGRMGKLFHIFPGRSEDSPLIGLFGRRILPLFMIQMLRQGLIFHEFVNCLEAFLGGNTVWNTCAFHRGGNGLEICYILNFAVPLRSIATTQANTNSTHRRSLYEADADAIEAGDLFPYCLISTLIYTSDASNDDLRRAELQIFDDFNECSLFAISESSALHATLQSAAKSAEGVHARSTDSFHLSLGLRSAMGWSMILAQIERQMRFLQREHRISSTESLQGLAELKKRLSAVSRATRQNMKAMEVLIKSCDNPASIITQGVKRDEFVSPDTFAVFYDGRGAKSCYELIDDLRELTDRSRELGGSLGDTIKEATMDFTIGATTDQIKIAFLSRGLNRVMGLTVMLFLPGIFISTLFSSNFFAFDDSGIMVTNSFWVFWAIMMPISVVIFAAVGYYTTSLRFQSLRDVFKALLDKFLGQYLRTERGRRVEPSQTRAADMI